MLQRSYGDTDFLTGMRAVAILLVFLLHSGGGGLRELGEVGNFLAESGKYGITVFFVISGYTIFSQFFKERYTLEKFLLVRLARISLPYYPVLLLVFAFVSLGGAQFNGWALRYNDGAISLANLAAHLVYLSPYDIHWQNTIIGVEWTLGIEVFFYFVLGALIHFNVVTLSGRSLVCLGTFSLGISLFTLLARSWFDLDPLFIYWMPFRYCYLFFLGGVSFVLRRAYLELRPNMDKGARRVSDIAQLLLLLGFATAALVPGIRQSPGISVEFGFGLGALVLIVLFRAEGELSGFLTSKALLLLGSMSYSFYLIHYIVVLTIPGSGNSQVDFLVWLVVSVLVSCLWYYLFESRLYSRVKAFIKHMP